MKGVTLCRYSNIIAVSIILLQFVEPTGKRFLLAIDVSGSMEYYKVLGSSSVSCRVASAAMAMVTAKTEENYHMVGFSSNLIPLKIHAKMRLDEVCKTISQVSKGAVQSIITFRSLHVYSLHKDPTLSIHSLAHTGSLCLSRCHDYIMICAGMQALNMHIYYIMFATTTCSASTLLLCVYMGHL